MSGDYMAGADAALRVLTGDARVDVPRLRRLLGGAYARGRADHATAEPVPGDRRGDPRLDRMAWVLRRSWLLHMGSLPEHDIPARPYERLEPEVRATYEAVAADLLALLDESDMAAALEATAPAAGLSWRPISDAPRDRPLLLARWEMHHPVVEWTERSDRDSPVVRRGRDTSREREPELRWVVYGRWSMPADRWTTAREPTHYLDPAALGLTGEAPDGTDAGAEVDAAVHSDLTNWR